MADTDGAAAVSGTAAAVASKARLSKLMISPRKPD
jgi:hypothetical protein